MFAFTTTGIALANGEVGYRHLIVVAALLLALAGTGWMAVKADGGSQLARGLTATRAALRLESLPMPVFVLALLLWASVTLVLVAGLILIVLSVVVSPAPAPDAGGALWEFRFKLAQLAVLTAVLGALVALPITLNRLKLAREANETAKDTLFNTQITEAAADLHAQRQVTRETAKGKRETVWEDDVIRRNAAIDRLEGLVKERQEVAERVARLLSTYVREMGREFPPVKAPEAEDVDVIRKWARGLKPARSDMENAVKVLGRLATTAGLTENTLPIDLRGANLQGFEMQGLDLCEADLSGAHMQGANLGLVRMRGAVLRGAQMQGVNLGGASMQAVNLVMAQMQGANLVRAQMQSANFAGAQMRGADLSKAQMEETNLGAVQMQGSNLSGAQMIRADVRLAQLQGANLRSARMQGANLNGADMQGAKLGLVQMQGANLIGAQMQGANLMRAQMQGANLGRSKMDDGTLLDFANLRGAVVRDVDEATITKLRAFWQMLFVDGTVRLPEGEVRPVHWDDNALGRDEVNDRWRAWQREIGFDPDDPK